MKPQNKRQAYILDLSQHLPALTDHQKQWAFSECLAHVAHRQKLKTACLDCGHVWPTKRGDDITHCPACAVKFTEVKDTREKITTQREFMTVLDVVEDIQITRFFEVKGYYKAGQQAELFIWEVIQYFMTTDGKHQLVARGKQNMGWYQDGFNGNMEIRKPDALTSRYCYHSTKTYPSMLFLDVYRRNGFDGDFHGITPYSMFTYLLTDAKTETLLKSKQYGLLQQRMSQSNWRKVDEFWGSIKICMRNNYVVPEEWAKDYIDYLDMLDDFGRDLHNPVYVCPGNLAEAHNKYVALKRAERERQQAQDLEQRRVRNEQERIKREQEKAERRAKIDEFEMEYARMKAGYFGLMFQSDNIVIKVLDSVAAFLKEGDTLNHCVFDKEYFLKEHSLILSACIGDRSIETIEVDLNQMKIEQARGLNNDITAHHSKIVDLVNKKMGVIRKMHSQLNKAV